jgi:hypothetical protein
MENDSSELEVMKGSAQNPPASIDPKDIKSGTTLLQKLQTFDMYAQPVNFVYNSKSKFSSNYGAFFSFLTIIFSIFVIIDNVIFFQSTTSCQFNKIEDRSQKAMTIDLYSQFLIFFATYDINTVK